VDERSKGRLLRRARQRIAQARRDHARDDRTADRVAAEFVVTTGDLPGRDVLEVVGIAGAEVVRALSALRDIAVAVRDDWGGRSATIERELATARAECLSRLAVDAAAMDADAVLSVRVTIAAPTTSVLLVAATGTAVRLVPLDDEDGADDAETPPTDPPASPEVPRP
jgi:uncharacterized protein YbjQ (UPF0145 family)